MWVVFFFFFFNYKQVLTRSEPFEGMGLIDISIDVMEGKRPPLPSAVPREVNKLVISCWHDIPNKRPTMTLVFSLLSDFLCVPPQ